MAPFRSACHPERSQESDLADTVQTSSRSVTRCSRHSSKLAVRGFPPLLPSFRRTFFARPLHSAAFTWYKQFRREQCVARWAILCNSRRASSIKCFEVISPGHGVRIRGQGSSKGFARTSKRSFLKLKRFRLDSRRKSALPAGRKLYRAARKLLPGRHLAVVETRLTASPAKASSGSEAPRPGPPRHVQILWESCGFCGLTASASARYV